MKHKSDAERPARLLSARFIGAMFIASATVGLSWWAIRAIAAASVSVSSRIALMPIGLVLSRAAYLLSLVGLARYRRDVADRLGNAGSARLAFWLFGAAWVTFCSFTLINLLPTGLVPASISTIRVVGGLLSLGGTIALLSMLAAGERGSGHTPTMLRLVAPVALAPRVWVLGISLIHLAGINLGARGLIDAAGITMRFIDAAAAVMLAIWLFGHARRAGAAQSSAWQLASADALISLRGALITRISVLVLGVLLAVLAGLARSMLIAKTVLYVLPFASVVTTLLVVGAIGRYALTARPVAGGGLAIGALVLLAAALSGEIGQLALLGKLGGSYYYSRAAMSTQLIYGAATQLLGLVGVALLLTSLQRVALRVANQTLAGKAATTRALIIVTAIAAVGLRALTMTRTLRGVPALLLGGAALVFAIVTFVLMLRLLESLAAALRNTRDPAASAPRKREADDELLSG